jgi:hypothetical protein
LGRLLPLRHRREVVHDTGTAGELRWHDHRSERDSCGCVRVSVRGRIGRVSRGA